MLGLMPNGVEKMVRYLIAALRHGGTGTAHDERRQDSKQANIHCDVPGKHVA